MIAATSPFFHHRTHRHSGGNKLCRGTFLALCFVLFVLLIDNQQKIASANAISAAAAEAQQNQQKHQQKMVRKSAGGWIQTYKEPKNEAAAAGEDDGTEEDRAEGVGDGQPTEDETEQQQEELSCTIKVHKVEKHSGKCVRLRGGSAACQTDTYLDPTSEDCMFLA
ncbi:hypothetical protein niasHT_035419 [Heterodera trifolii]|uniref:Uncharacterized protein n=1 Tax=Heterodera trifolii TaxID=157864 RepID=A0ABD2IIN6_9BILA